MTSKTSLHRVRLNITEPILGTCPSDPSIYSQHVATKKHKAEKKLAKTAEELDALNLKEAALIVEEAALLPPVGDEDPKGMTVFRRGTDGNLLMSDHMIRGFLKEAGAAVGIDGKSVWGLTSKIDRWVFVVDENRKPVRQLPLLRDGKPIMAPDGTLERPLRAMTMQGPRVTLACSEVVNPPAYLEFFIYTLALGTDAKHNLGLETMKQWFDYGAFVGLGQWRSGGMGRFSATVVAAGNETGRCAFAASLVDEPIDVE